MSAEAATQSEKLLVTSISASHARKVLSFAWGEPSYASHPQNDACRPSAKLEPYPPAAGGSDPVSNWGCPTASAALPWKKLAGRTSASFAKPAIEVTVGATS